MNKKIYKKIEHRLQRYYKQLVLTESMKRQISLYIKHIDDIKREIKDLNNIEIITGKNMGIDYSRDKIQTSPTGSGDGEKGIIDYITKLEIELITIKKRKIKLEMKLRAIELDNLITENAITNLREEDQKILKYKYKYRYTLNNISIKMNWNSPQTTDYNINNSIREIGKILGMVK